MEVEYNYVMVTHSSVRNNFTFKPLTVKSREEIGPRLLITQFDDIPFKGIGQPLCGPSITFVISEEMAIATFKLFHFTLVAKKSTTKKSGK